jgi:Putative papain-like cysteine peptidase (DUF1796)
MSSSDTLFIPFGHRCSSAAILDRCHLCDKSLPFDSVVSQLSVITDCLTNGFDTFLDVKNYVKVSTRTVNIIDGLVEVCCDEMPNVNKYYEDAVTPGNAQDLTNHSTYHLQLALTHHDLSSADDYGTFARRCARLDVLLKDDRKKVYVYIHPIMGTSDYDKGRDRLIDTFLAFSQFMAKRSANIFGLFFMMVKPPHRDVGSRVHIVTADSCSVYVIYVNEGFVDAGAPFSGDCEGEITLIADIIKEHSL